MKNILTSRDRFVDACKAYEEAATNLSNLTIDVQIAARANRPTAEVEEAKSKYLQEEWYPAYTERKQALAALAGELGVDLASIRAAV